MRHSGNMGKSGMMNKAQMAEPKSGHTKAAPAAGVGNERKADVAGAQGGGSMAEAGGLRGAVKHLEHMHSAAHYVHKK